MYLLTIIWIIFKALIHSTRPGLYVKPHRNYYRLVQRDAYWPRLPWVLSFFNVFFSHHWLRRRSTKPALLYAILRNLKILVLKRRCVLDSFIGTINRHRSSLNNFTPQPRELHIGRVRDGRLSLALVCSTVTVYYLGIRYDWGTCLNTVISLLCSWQMSSCRQLYDCGD